MTELHIFAEAFRYPTPGRLDQLHANLLQLNTAAAQAEYLAFLQALHPLSLGAWEELHTRTLDLNPELAPYIGYQMWGDSYKRGRFLSQMSHTLQAHEIERDGELPDHLVPVLRYLDLVPDPLPELMEILIPALEKMLGSLEKKEMHNPYTHLVRAVLSACQEH